MKKASALSLKIYKYLLNRQLKTVIELRVIMNQLRLLNIIYDFLSISYTNY